MKNKKNRLMKQASVALACAILAACSASDVSVPQLNSGAASAGDADFTTYVAIGDSLTAGYADGGLYKTGQMNSFPNILATQFADVGGGVFTQPLAATELGGFLIGGQEDPDLGNRFVLNTETESPERLTDTPTEEITNSGLNGNVYNNMGVPGAKSYHLAAPGYGAIANLGATANPFFVRFSLDVNDPAETVIADAVAQGPTFFTLWIGNNDVLSYATSGGVVDTPCKPVSDPTGCDNNAITDATEFAGVYGQLLAALTANPATKGVLANVPDVKSIPFFTTVPYNAIPLDQATADTLNASYDSYNVAIQGAGLPADEVAKRTINFTEGQNAVVIEDEDLSPVPGLPKMRQATADDLILLPAGAYLGTEDPNSVGNTPATGPWGLGTPLEDSDVLIPSEIQDIDTARTAFNDTIKAAADADANLALYDAAAMMDELKASGISFGTGSVTADFATGGAFSLDGVHPTARGYALIANGIVDTINAAFNANVYKVDPVNYTTIFLK